MSNDSVSGERPEDKARRLVYEYIKTDPFTIGYSDFETFALDEVLLVWFCKTLQNWKALVITTLPDMTYYELTYNGDARETYIDTYSKSHNVRIFDLSKEG